MRVNYCGAESTEEARSKLAPVDTGDYRAAVTGILGSASHETSARLERFWAAARGARRSAAAGRVTRDDLEAAVADAVTEWITPLIPAGAPEGFWRIEAPGGCG